MLSVADMAGMRTTLNTSLPDTCTVKRDTLVSDNAGGQTIGSVATATMACRISPRLATGTGQLKDAEVDSAGRIVAQAPWLITLPALVILDTRDHVQSADGRVFEVFAVLSRRSNELDTLVLARLINEGAG